jgi:Protein of unknown function (DUF3352)
VTVRSGIAAIVLALALAGCGGGDESSAGGDSAASIAPAAAVAYASFDTDLDSNQWQQADELLRRFPGRAKLLDFLRESLADEGVDWETEVRPALGPTIELVALGFESVEQDLIGLAQPADAAKFEQLLEEGEDPVVSREVEEWTVFAETEAALDRFEQARGTDSLADQEDFEELMAELPDEALAKAWFDAEKLTGAAASDLGGSIPQLAIGRPTGVSVALEAADQGARMLAHFRVEDATVEGRDFGELGELVPADAFAFVNVHGQDGQLKVTEQLRGLPFFAFALGEIEREIGVTLDDVSTLFNKEIALWVRPGTIIPEVTLVLEVDDEREARATVDRIADAAGSLGPIERRPRQVGDVEATEVDLGQFSILYATVDGKLVVTTQASGIEALTDDADRLVDDDRYKDSVDAAGVTADENVAMWVDVQQAFAVFQTLSALGEEPIPPDVDENVEPIEAVVFSMEPSFEEGSMRLFVHVR